MTWIIHQRLWGSEVEEELHLGYANRESRIPLGLIIVRYSGNSWLFSLGPINQSHNLFFFSNTCLTVVENWLESLIICYTKFRTINFPCFLHVFLSSPAYYSTMLQGERLTSSPPNKTHEYSIVKRLRNIDIYYISHIHNKITITVHRMDIYWNKWLLAHSSLTVREYCNFVQCVSAL
jgi:hypothetical protein